jgi:hypothetical protein
MSGFRLGASLTLTWAGMTRKRFVSDPRPDPLGGTGLFAVKKAIPF